jgi:hypothetical protein
MMSPFLTRPLSAILLGTTLLTGCTGWDPATAPTPSTQPADTTAHRVLVWSQGRRYELRDAVWRGDTLVGREARSEQPLPLLRESIDSVRVRRWRPAETFLLVGGIVAVGIVGGIIIAYMIECSGAESDGC